MALGCHFVWDVVVLVKYEVCEVVSVMVLLLDLGLDLDLKSEVRSQRI